MDDKEYHVARFSHKQELATHQTIIMLPTLIKPIMLKLVHYIVTYPPRWRKESLPRNWNIMLSFMMSGKNVTFNKGQPAREIFTTPKGAVVDESHRWMVSNKTT